jgi:hypothetical protein
VTTTLPSSRATLRLIPRAGRIEILQIVGGRLIPGLTGTAICDADGGNADPYEPL